MTQRNPCVSGVQCFLSPHSGRPGFTLVELLAFVAVIGIMAGAIVSFSFFSTNVGTTSEVRAEVEQNAQHVLDRLEREIQEADLIAYPPLGKSDHTLVLVDVLQESPLELKQTIIHAYHGYVRIAETQDDVTTFSYLTNSKVGVEQLVFLHFGGGGSEEGVSSAFQMFNKARGADFSERQYLQKYRGTTTVRAFACSVDADCESGNFCCSGVCSSSTCPAGCGQIGQCDRGPCAVDAECGTGNVCCNGFCSDLGCPAPCLSVNDCSIQEPFCQNAGGSVCQLQVPYCASAGTCQVTDGGPCDECVWCGDGRVSGAEGCDDGCVTTNNPPGCDASPPTATDGCSNSCEVASCGDGIIFALMEECDDGDLANGDGCSGTCRLEEVCTEAGESIDVVFVVEMGNHLSGSLQEMQVALRTFTEYMDFTSSPKDAGALLSFASDAQVNQPLTSTESSLQSAVSGLALGDSGRNLEQGITQARSELASGAGDTKAMIILANKQPNFTGSPSTGCTMTVPPTPDDGCGVIAAASAAKAEGIKIYTVQIGTESGVSDLLQAIRTPPDAISNYYFATSENLLAVYEQLADEVCNCGNGIVDVGEQCDDGNDFNQDGCSNACGNALCGDGFVQSGMEQCDDDNTIPGDGCNGSCQVEASQCGNGTVEGSEKCDDGKHCENGTTPCFSGPDCLGIGSGTCAARSGDGCSAACQPEVTGDSSCFTDGRPCFRDVDCFEPDSANCASCIDFQCAPPAACVAEGRPASDLLGQVNGPADNPVYTASAANNGGSVGERGIDTWGMVYAKGDVALDATGHRLFVSDTNNNRVLVFQLTNENTVDGTSPNDRIADYVLGQNNVNASAPQTVQDRMNNPYGLAFAGNSLFVADAYNHRVLVFDVASVTNGENAVSVLGQSDFDSAVAAVTQEGMNEPHGLDVNADATRLYIADKNNNRVLIFDISSIVNGESAVGVLGQTDFVSSDAPSPPASASLNSPEDVAFSQFGSAETLYVSDTGNNRVLGFDVSESSCP